MIHVHRINRPLEVGERVLVPVVDGLVVLWPPHKDQKDGQPEYHYHIDQRFAEDPSRLIRPVGRHTWEVRTVARDFAVSEEQGVQSQIGATHVGMITEAIKDVRCNAIKNGKCPHRGFNMMQVRQVAGMRVCPMHGMRFNQSGAGVPYRLKKAVDEEWLVDNDAKL